MSNRLKNIACGLIGTFVSRNNDIHGYWGIGVLRALAARSGDTKVTIDIFGDNTSDPSLSFIASKYGRWIVERVESEKIHVENLSGIIELRFTPFEEFPDTVRDTRGDPYVCTVTLLDGTKRYSATKIGVCEIHDPTKEYRRAF